VRIQNKRQTDWVKYADFVKNKLESLESPKEIHSFLDIEIKATGIADIPRMAFNEACPGKTLKPGFKPVKWWSAELSAIRRESRRLYRVYAFSRAPEDWCHYKISRNLFKKASRKAKKDSWKRFCESIKDIPEAARVAKILKNDKSSN